MTTHTQWITTGFAAIIMLANGIGAWAQEPVTAPASGTVATPVTNKLWNLSIDAGLNYASGNSDSLSLTYGARWVWDKRPHRGEISLQGQYGEKDRLTSDDNAEVMGDYGLTHNERLYFLVHGSLGYDNMANIDYRVVIGPSVQYFFVRGERFSLRADAGPSYVWTGYAVEGLVDYPAMRVSERAEFVVSKSANIWETLEWIPALGTGDGYLLNAEVGIETAVVPWLSVKVMARNRYNSEPPEEKKSNDFSLLAALSYKI